MSCFPPLKHDEQRFFVEHHTLELYKSYLLIECGSPPNLLFEIRKIFRIFFDIFFRKDNHIFWHILNIAWSIVLWSEKSRLLDPGDLDFKKKVFK